MSDAATPSLALARDLRRALKRRADELAPAIEAYDFATDGASRFRAAANLMLAIENTDRRFADDKAAAVRRCEEAESPPTERTP